MAKLQSGSLTLDIKIGSIEDEWISYEIKFHWKDDVIINDNVLKRAPEWWSKTPYGTFLANDYQKDYLIETLRTVLETNKPEYWEPIEPDVKMGIYPGTFFPFLKSHWTLIESEEIEQDGGREDEEEIVQEVDRKLDEVKNQCDLFTIITLIDQYNFRGSDAYSGEGISLHMIVERKDLEKFVTDLEIEYNMLALRHD